MSSSLEQGITGLSAAYELACAGRKVLILDRAGVGAGMTGRTTAHLASALDDYYHVPARKKDEKELEACREIGMGGVDWQTIELGDEERQGCLFPTMDGTVLSGPATKPLTVEKEV